MNTDESGLVLVGSGPQSSKHYEVSICINKGEEEKGVETRTGKLRRTVRRSTV